MPLRCTDVVGAAARAERQPAVRAQSVGRHHVAPVPSSALTASCGLVSCTWPDAALLPMVRRHLGGVCGEATVARGRLDVRYAKSERLKDRWQRTAPQQRTPAL